MEENRNANLDPTNNESGESSRLLECAICLQTCIHPVRLPCRHIFCFLCVKGIANQSKRCAMCRQEIPLDYLDKPDLVPDFEPEPEMVMEDGFQWFYEGRNGWWQYDERTSSELETAFKRGETRCEVLVAGFLYVVDFHHMIQLRRNDPSRRRRIKRDHATIPKKGVAGIRLTSSEDSTNEESTDNLPVSDNHNLGETTAEQPVVQNCIDTNCLLVSKTPSTTPATPTNTPQTPIFVSGDTETSVPSSPGRSLENLDQSLAEALHTLRLHDRTESAMRGNNIQPLLEMRRQTRIHPWDIEIMFSEEEEL